MSKEFMNPPVVETVVAEEAKETTVQPEEKKDTILGVVTECGYLKVRSTPEVKDDNILTEIMLTDEVLVDLSESTEDFYKVTTGAGLEGYCMKKFINIEA